jgi:hypothetical protein
MIIRIRTVYDDRLWIDSEDLARARGRGRKLILIRDRSGARRCRNGDSLPRTRSRTRSGGDLLLHIDNIAGGDGQ